MTQTVRPSGSALSDSEPPRLGIAPPGYRLPDALRLGAVRLQVADLARSQEYYDRVLGLRPVAQQPGSATLAPPDDPLTPLVELVERPGARAPHPQSLLGLYHFAILLPDRAALGRLVAHLSRSGERAGASDHLVSEALYLRDPDGLGIEVYADRPRSAWVAVDGQLRMATDPLDGDSLLRASMGEPWQGMPAGATMGHVHLHVGEIDVATRFYHVGLGLDRMVWSYPGALFLSAGGYHHHLGVNTWAGADASRPGPGDAQLLEWRIVLPDPADLVAAAESLVAAGFSATREGDAWVTADPWGTRLRLVAA